MPQLWPVGTDTLYSRVNRRRLLPSLTPPNEGTTTLTLPSPTAALTGVAVDEGATLLLLPSLTLALTGEVVSEGMLSLSLPVLTAGLTGTVQAEGVLSATLPELALSLAAQALTAGQLVATLPELTASVTAQAITQGSVDMNLPQLTASFAVEAAAEGELGVSLPETELVLGGYVDNGDSLLLVVLPSPDMSVQGEVSNEATLNVLLPPFQMNVQAEIAADGTLDLDIPSVQLFMNGIAQVLGGGSLDLVLPALDMYGGWKARVMREQESQRQTTREFIAADPVFVALTPAVTTRKASGATAVADGVPRPVQMFRMIPMSSSERPERSNSSAEQGQQSKYDFTLLAEWGAVVKKGDWWEDEDGQRWQVDSVVPGHGYEVKAMVTSMGEDPNG